MFSGYSATNTIMLQDQLILVDTNDQIVGYGEKMEIHRQGLLHRAFSIFVTNSNHEVLLQRRALHKYHSGGLWANTCCSHPIKGEDIESTVHRRLNEEMGMSCALDHQFSFIYRAELDRGLIEHELDHVFWGRYDGKPDPNPEEVDDWKWLPIDQLNDDLINKPEHFVYWIKPAFERFYELYNSNVENI